MQTCLILANSSLSVFSVVAHAFDVIHKETAKSEIMRIYPLFSQELYVFSSSYLGFGSF